MAENLNDFAVFALFPKNQLTKVTDPNDTETTVAYDYMGRPNSVSSGGNVVAVTYDEIGNVTEVTDDANHDTVYAYDYNNQPTLVTDADSNKLAYQYDSYGRLTKSGGGTSATVSPTTFEYSSTLGLLTKVNYSDGSTTKSAEYVYDYLARVTRVKDWIDNTNGIQYAYNSANRLTKVTDYDGTEAVTYAYDSAGRATSMTDTHGGVSAVTSYTYTTRGQLSTLTGPGGKTWYLAYRADGQPGVVVLPNGMFTAYGYDARGRMTNIAHQTGYGGSNLESYGYTMDKAGLINRIDQVDSSYWTYAYDARYRLTGAVRHNAADTIQATYAYTYDDGDNLVTKVEPWVDDFTDGTVSDDGLSVSGTWAVTSGAAQNVSSASGAALYRTINDDDLEFRYSYLLDSYTAATPYVDAYFRYNTTTSERLVVRFRVDQAELRTHNGSGWGTVWTNTSATTATGTKYNVRVEADGAHVRVWRSLASGGLETLILDVTTAPTYDGNRLRMIVSPDTVVSFDDFLILANDSGMNRTTTLAVNTANELSTFADYNGTTSYTYDELGRMISKARGTASATYAWHLDDRLMQVNSNFPGEGVVDYNYGGDGNRRSRTYNSATTFYNWDAGYNVLSEESGTGSGSLTRTFIGRTAAHIDSSTPSSGTYSYYTQDHLASTRGVYDASKNLTASFEFSPYGDPYLFANAGNTTRRYTGHDFDPMTGMYFAPFRYYAPGMERWISSDPLGMVDGPNVHAYVQGSPTNLVDLDGRGVFRKLWCWIFPCKDKDPEVPITTQCGNAQGTGADMIGTTIIKKISPKGFPGVIDPLVGAAQAAPDAYNVGKRLANNRDLINDLSDGMLDHDNGRAEDPKMAPPLPSDVYGPRCNKP